MNVRKFKFLRRKSLAGKILRLPFDLIPGNSVFPIVWGQLKRSKWIKGSHNLSILFGTYEKAQTRAFAQACNDVKVFWDLGAHVGYYSLLFRSANGLGKIIAFEPLPRNAELFVRHMTLNKVEGYEIYNKAVSDKHGVLTFNTGKTSVAGKLSNVGDLTVDVIKISDWVKNGVMDIPGLIKMDIEGEEYNVLMDIREILSTYKPMVFLSTHGHAVHQDCLDLLQSLNYSFKPLDSEDIKSCKELLVY